ncbi:hypothetical protein PMIN01_07491 [Paraphaeosphaeria minitans]|uniref:Uncharacterized protein n=1 Tax=Paraphaeosphaeria minitans TaxID=565426 RepID=A0A9P6KPE1_9PLEO|nr:hypothetical protein PMIN01_07491 [Paraphaeosphaeria minitans]
MTFAFSGHSLGKLPLLQLERSSRGGWDVRCSREMAAVDGNVRRRGRARDTARRRGCRAWRCIATGRRHDRSKGRPQESSNWARGDIGARKTARARWVGSKFLYDAGCVHAASCRIPLHPIASHCILLSVRCSAASPRFQRRPPVLLCRCRFCCATCSTAKYLHRSATQVEHTRSVQVRAGGCRWVQVGAGGCRWVQVDASGCKWVHAGAGAVPVTGARGAGRMQHRLYPKKLAPNWPLPVDVNGRPRDMEAAV